MCYLMEIPFSMKLYIPHSSDKTRVKAGSIVVEVCFTSHIVQIKPFTNFAQCLYFLLYIPHSSDKTPGSGQAPGSAQALYIPHSSDKTVLFSVYFIDNESTLHPT